MVGWLSARGERGLTCRAVVSFSDPQHGAAREGAARSGDGSGTSCSPERPSSHFPSHRAGLYSRISPRTRAWLGKALGAGQGTIQLRVVSVGMHKEQTRGKGCGT